MFRIQILFLLLILKFLSYSQTKEIDACKIIIKSNQNDTIKLQALSDLNWYFAEINYKTSKKYAFDELNLANKIKNKKWIAQSYNDIGIACQRMGQNDSALFYYGNSLDIREKLKDDQLIASSLSKIGLIYNDIGDYQKSLENQFKVLKIYEKDNDSLKIGVTLNNISLVFSKLKNSEKTIYYSKRAMSYYDPIKNDYNIAQCYGNIAFAYANLKKYKLSNSYNEKALIIFKKYQDKVSIAGIENGLGVNLKKQGKFELAQKHYLTAYSLADEMDDFSGKAIYATNLSEVLKKTGKYKDAEKYMLEVLNSTDTINKAQLLFCYKQLSSIYSYLNNGEKADFYLEKFANLKEELFNNESANEIASVEVKYVTEKMKRELAEKNLKIEANKKWITLSLSAVFFVLLVLFFVYRYQKAKRKNIIKQSKLNEELEKSRIEKDFLDEKLRIGRELHDNIGSHLTFMISSLDNLEYVENPQVRIDKIADLSNFGRLTMKDLRDTIWAMNHEEGSFEQLITRISELRSVLPSTLHVNIKSDIENSQSLNGLQLLNCYRI
ncbi:MAG: tetratricopeptide repeat protein, partial [Bacteroidota bacterium]